MQKNTGAAGWPQACVHQALLVAGSSSDASAAPANVHAPHRYRPRRTAVRSRTAPLRHCIRSQELTSNIATRTTITTPPCAGPGLRCPHNRAVARQPCLGQHNKSSTRAGRMASRSGGAEEEVMPSAQRPQRGLGASGHKQRTPQTAPCHAHSGDACGCAHQTHASQWHTRNAHSKRRRKQRHAGQCCRPPATTQTATRSASRTSINCTVCEQRSTTPKTEHDHGKCLREQTKHHATHVFSSATTNDASIHDGLCATSAPAPSSHSGHGWQAPWPAQHNHEQRTLLSCHIRGYTAKHHSDAVRLHLQEGLDANARPVPLPNPQPLPRRHGTECIGATIALHVCAAQQTGKTGWKGWTNKCKWKRLQRHRTRRC